jgi:hypothetical protein
MRAAGLAVGLALIASAATGAETYGVKAARVALSGKSEAVLVAVPRGFFRADVKLAGDASKAGDWQFFFNDWVKRRGARSNVVVITPEDLKTLLRRPTTSRECVTLWVRDRAHALVYDASCAPTAAVYDAGDRWLVSGPAPEGFREAELRIR